MRQARIEQVPETTCLEGPHFFSRRSGGLSRQVPHEWISTECPDQNSNNMQLKVNAKKNEQIHPVCLKE